MEKTIGMYFFHIHMGTQKYSGHPKDLACCSLYNNVKIKWSQLDVSPNKSE